MAELVRVSFTIEQELNDRIEKYLKKSKRTNRSKFMCDVLRQELVNREWSESKAEVLGTLTLIYDHHIRGLNDKLTALQHDHVESIMAATHVHMDHHHCAEMIMMKGAPAKLRELAEQLGQLKGVLHATLSLSSTGKHLH